MLDIVASYHCMQFQGKLMNQIWENGKKPSFGPDFGPLLPKFVPPKKILWILPLLDVRHCCKAINVYNFKELMNRTWENGKKSIFGPNFGPSDPNSCHQFFFFQNLTFLVTRYHGQLSSCTILEKTNDLILRKRIDGRTDGWMDLRTDG